MNNHASLLAIILIVLSTNLSTSFTLQTSSTLLTRHLKKHSTRSTLHMARGYSDRKANSATIKSKRQNRVGETVRAEVAGILFNGYEVKCDKPLDASLRSQISVLDADVSPDLRQARISVSILSAPKNDDNILPPEIAKRRIFSWLTSNTPQIRHALAQRLSHMKGIPHLTFVLSDIGSAVSVMNLIDKISNEGYTRENLGRFGGEGEEMPEGFYLDEDEDEEEYLDDGELEDEEDDEDDDLLNLNVEWNDDDDDE
ncbi:hypothetical protein TrLO_g10002 [Triparma laevis f. longispina]|uniref:Ribosome-binding factor A n=1 Tax=Triparma laevis f. longispina TaxID=1714387 RepID=A0A9W7DUQ3_9STRA|nr:hypothetical protein TrLO_g10002 [Triparma laevis f. longispina]